MKLKESRKKGNKVQINTKFNLGDRVWMYKDEESCDICNNPKGRLFSDPEWHDCPKCRGTGIVKSNVSEKSSGPFFIISIKTEMTIDRVILSETYRLENRGDVVRGYYDVSELFSSKEEAEVKNK